MIKNYSLKTDNQNLILKSTIISRKQYQLHFTQEIYFDYTVNMDKKNKFLVLVVHANCF